MNKTVRPYLNQSGLDLNVDKAILQTEFGGWGRFTAANKTITLPDVAAVMKGKIFTFVGGSVGGTVVTSSSQNIVTPNSSIIQSQPVAANTCLTLVSNGVEWQVLMYNDVGLRNDMEAALQSLTDSVNALVTSLNT
jgi:hypothetical protein